MRINYKLFLLIGINLFIIGCLASANYIILDEDNKFDRPIDYKIAYQSERIEEGVPYYPKERTDIFIYDIRDSKQIASTEGIERDNRNINFCYPKWSPDGKKVAFYSMEREVKTEYNLYKIEVWVMGEYGDNIKKLVSFEHAADIRRAYPLSEIDWNRDSNKLCYVRSNIGYLIVDIDTLEVTEQSEFREFENEFKKFSCFPSLSFRGSNLPLYPNPFLSSIFISISPKQKYTVIHRPTYHLFSREPGGWMDGGRKGLEIGKDTLYLKSRYGNRKFAFEGIYEEEFSIDDEYLILEGADKNEIHIIHTESGKKIKSLDGCNVTMQYLGSIYNDDGTREYFIDTRSREYNALNLRTILTAKGRIDLLPDGAQLEEGIISSDQVIYEDKTGYLNKEMRTDIFKSDLEGKNRINLTEQIRSNNRKFDFYSPRISPDNNKIAFISVEYKAIHDPRPRYTGDNEDYYDKIGIWIMNIDGSNPKMLYSFQKPLETLVTPKGNLEPNDILKFGVRWSLDSQRVTFFEYNKNDEDEKFLSIPINNSNNIEEVLEWENFQRSLNLHIQRLSKIKRDLKESLEFESPNKRYLINRETGFSPEREPVGMAPEKSYILNILHKRTGYKRKVIPEDVNFIQWTSDSRYFIFTYRGVLGNLTRIFLSDYKGNVITSFPGDSPVIARKITTDNP